MGIYKDDTIQNTSDHKVALVLDMGGVNRKQEDSTDEDWEDGGPDAGRKLTVNCS